MATLIEKSKPYSTHLTKESLEAVGLAPLYGGTFWSKRFGRRKRSTGTGEDLTGAVIVFTRRFGDVVITRRSDVTSTGAPTAQVVLDDQSTEDLVEGEGTGWFQVYDYPVADEVAEFELALGDEDFVQGTYDISAAMPDGITQFILWSGQCDCSRPVTSFPIET